MIGAIRDFSMAPPAARPIGGAEHNLRQWLHRIDEACARKDATPEILAIRAAALAALRGDPAPRQGLNFDRE